ncbi:hypothetical protein EVA_11111 [gut metagenome]|uniref:Uncharacterized protein n=1 Tax=gut metagenome TaxID=749906 RepID=J9G0M1_9ZZZZ
MRPDDAVFLISSIGKKPFSAKSGYSAGQVCPLDNTKRSRSSHWGFAGSTRICTSYR